MGLERVDQDDWNGQFAVDLGRWKPELHPRDSKGRFRDAWGLSPAAMSYVDRLLARFNPSGFASDNDAATKLRQKKPPRSVEQKAALQRFLSRDGNENIQSTLRAGDAPTSDIKALDAMMRPLDEDLIVSRVFGPDALGLRPEQIDGVEEWTGKRVLDAGFSPTNVGNPYQIAGPHIEMRLLVPKGTKAIIVGDDGGPSEARTVILDREQPIRFGKIQKDGRGGWYILATVDPARSPSGKEPARALGRALPAREMSPAIEATPQELERRGLPVDAGVPGPQDQPGRYGEATPSPGAGQQVLPQAQTVQSIPNPAAAGPVTQGGPPGDVPAPAKAIKKAGGRAPVGGGQVVDQGTDLTPPRKIRQRPSQQVVPEEQARAADAQKRADDAVKAAEARQARLDAAEKVLATREAAAAQERAAAAEQMAKANDSLAKTVDQQQGLIDRLMGQPVGQGSEGGTVPTGLTEQQKDAVLRRAGKVGAPDEQARRERLAKAIRAERAAAPAKKGIKKAAAKAAPEAAAPAPVEKATRASTSSVRPGDSITDVDGNWHKVGRVEYSGPRVLMYDDNGKQINEVSRASRIPVRRAGAAVAPAPAAATAKKVAATKAAPRVNHIGNQIRRDQFKDLTSGDVVELPARNGRPVRQATVDFVDSEGTIHFTDNTKITPEAGAVKVVSQGDLKPSRAAQAKARRASDRAAAGLSTNEALKAAQEGRITPEQAARNLDSKIAGYRELQVRLGDKAPPELQQVIDGLEAEVRRLRGGEAPTPEEAKKVAAEVKRAAKKVAVAREERGVEGPLQVERPVKGAKAAAKSIKKVTPAAGPELVDASRPDAANVNELRQAKSLADINAVAAKHGIRIPSTVGRREDRRAFVEKALSMQDGESKADYDARIAGLGVPPVKRGRGRPPKAVAPAAAPEAPAAPAKKATRLAKKAEPAAPVKAVPAKKAIKAAPERPVKVTRAAKKTAPEAPAKKVAPAKAPAKAIKKAPTKAATIDKANPAESPIEPKSTKVTAPKTDQELAAEKPVLKPRFTATRGAKEYRPSKLVKTARLVDTAPDGHKLGPDEETTITVDYGNGPEPQTFRGPWMEVLGPDGSRAYGSALREWNENNEQVRGTKDGWVKITPVTAYRHTGPSRRVETVIKKDGKLHNETGNTAVEGDWIVRQPNGEVMVTKDAEFQKRYQTKAPQSVGTHAVRLRVQAQDAKAKEAAAKKAAAAAKKVAPAKAPAKAIKKAAAKAAPEKPVITRKAAAKKAAVPEKTAPAKVVKAVPETTGPSLEGRVRSNGQIPLGKILKGDKVLVERNENGTWRPSSRVTKATPITVDRVEAVSERRGMHRTTVNKVIVGHDAAGNEVRTIASHGGQTYKVAPAPKAAKVAKAAPQRPAITRKAAKKAAPPEKSSIRGGPPPEGAGSRIQLTDLAPGDPDLLRDSSVADLQSKLDAGTTPQGAARLLRRRANSLERVGVPADQIRKLRELADRLDAAGGEQAFIGTRHISTGDVQRGDTIITDEGRFRVNRIEKTATGRIVFHDADGNQMSPGPQGVDIDATTSRKPLPPQERASRRIKPIEEAAPAKKAAPAAKKVAKAAPMKKAAPAKAPAKKAAVKAAAPAKKVAPAKAAPTKKAAVKKAAPAAEQNLDAYSKDLQEKMGPRLKAQVFGPQSGLDEPSVQTYLKARRGGDAHTTALRRAQVEQGKINNLRAAERKKIDQAYVAKQPEAARRRVAAFRDANADQLGVRDSAQLGRLDDSGKETYWTRREAGADHKEAITGLAPAKIARPTKIATKAPAKAIKKAAPEKPTITRRPAVSSMTDDDVVAEAAKIEGTPATPRERAIARKAGLINTRREREAKKAAAPAKVIKKAAAEKAAPAKAIKKTAPAKAASTIVASPSDAATNQGRGAIRDAIRDVDRNEDRSDIAGRLRGKAEELLRGEPLTNDDFPDRLHRSDEDIRDAARSDASRLNRLADEMEATPSPTSKVTAPTKKATVAKAPVKAIRKASPTKAAAPGQPKLSQAEVIDLQNMDSMPHNSDWSLPTNAAARQRMETLVEKGYLRYLGGGKIEMTPAGRERARSEPLHPKSWEAEGRVPANPARKQTVSEAVPVKEAPAEAAKKLAPVKITRAAEKKAAKKSTAFREPPAKAAEPAAPEAPAKKTAGMIRTARPGRQEGAVPALREATPQQRKSLLAKVRRAGSQADAEAVLRDEVNADVMREIAADNGIDTAQKTIPALRKELAQKMRSVPEFKALKRGGPKPENVEPAVAKKAARKVTPATPSADAAVRAVMNRLSPEARQSVLDAMTPEQRQAVQDAIGRVDERLAARKAARKAAHAAKAAVPEAPTKAARKVVKEAAPAAPAKAVKKVAKVAPEAPAAAPAKKAIRPLIKRQGKAVTSAEARKESALEAVRGHDMGNDAGTMGEYRVIERNLQSGDFTPAQAKGHARREALKWRRDAKAVRADKQLPDRDRNQANARMLQAGERYDKLAEAIEASQTRDRIDAKRFGEAPAPAAKKAVAKKTSIKAAPTKAVAKKAEPTTAPEVLQARKQRAARRAEEAAKPETPEAKKSRLEVARQAREHDARLAAERKADDKAHAEFIKPILKDAGVKEADLSELDRTGLRVVADKLRDGKISKATAARRLRTDRDSKLNNIADAIEAKPRKASIKKAAKAAPEAPAKKAPAKAIKKAAPEKPTITRRAEKKVAAKAAKVAAPEAPVKKAAAKKAPAKAIKKAVDRNALTPDQVAERDALTPEQRQKYDASIARGIGHDTAIRGVPRGDQLDALRRTTIPAGETGTRAPGVGGIEELRRPSAQFQRPQLIGNKRLSEEEKDAILKEVRDAKTANPNWPLTLEDRDLEREAQGIEAARLGTTKAAKAPARSRVTGEEIKPKKVAPAVVKTRAERARRYDEAVPDIPGPEGKVLRDAKDDLERGETATSVKQRLTAKAQTYRDLARIQRESGNEEVLPGEAARLDRLAEHYEKAADLAGKRIPTTKKQIKRGAKVPVKDLTDGDVAILNGRKGLFRQPSPRKTFFEFPDGSQQPVKKTALAQMVRNKDLELLGGEHRPETIEGEKPAKVVKAAKKLAARKVAKVAAETAPAAKKAPAKKVGLKKAAPEVAKAAPAKKVTKRATKAVKATEAPTKPVVTRKATKEAPAEKFLPPLANGTRRKSATNLKPGDRVRRAGGVKDSKAREVDSVEREGNQRRVRFTDGTSRLDNPNTAYWMADVPPERSLRRGVRVQDTTDETLGSAQQIVRDLDAGRITRAEARKQIRELPKGTIGREKRAVRQAEPRPEVPQKRPIITRAKDLIAERRADLRTRRNNDRAQGVDALTQARERGLNVRDSEIRRALEADGLNNGPAARRRLESAITTDRQQANLLDYGTVDAPDGLDPDFVGGTSARSRRLRQRALQRSQAVDLLRERGAPPERSSRRLPGPIGGEGNVDTSLESRRAKRAPRVTTPGGESTVVPFKRAAKKAAAPEAQAPTVAKVATKAERPTITRKAASAKKAAPEASAAKKVATKAPAKKVAAEIGAPTPREEREAARRAARDVREAAAAERASERNKKYGSDGPSHIDLKKVGDGLDMRDEEGVARAQADLNDGKTPTEVAKKLDFIAQGIKNSAAIRYGGWDSKANQDRLLDDPAYYGPHIEKMRQDYESWTARGDRYEELAKRLRATRRPVVRKAAAPEAPAKKVIKKAAPAASVTEAPAAKKATRAIKKAAPAVAEKPTITRKATAAKKAAAATPAAEGTKSSPELGDIRTRRARLNTRISRYERKRGDSPPGKVEQGLIRDRNALNEQALAEEDRLNPDGLARTSGRDLYDLGRANGINDKLPPDMVRDELRKKGVKAPAAKKAPAKAIKKAVPAKKAAPARTEGSLVPDTGPIDLPEGSREVRIRSIQDGDVAVWSPPGDTPVRGRVVRVQRGSTTGRVTHSTFVDWEGGRRERLSDVTRNRGGASNQNTKFYRPGEKAPEKPVVKRAAKTAAPAKKTALTKKAAPTKTAAPEPELSDLDKRRLARLTPRMQEQVGKLSPVDREVYWRRREQYQRTTHAQAMKDVQYNNKIQKGLQDVRGADSYDAARTSLDKYSDDELRSIHSTGTTGGNTSGLTRDQLVNSIVNNNVSPETRRKSAEARRGRQDAVKSVIDDLNAKKLDKPTAIQQLRDLNTNESKELADGLEKEPNFEPVNFRELKAGDTVIDVDGNDRDIARVEDGVPYGADGKPIRPQTFARNEVLRTRKAPEAPAKAAKAVARRQPPRVDTVRKNLVGADGPEGRRAVLDAMDDDMTVTKWRKLTKDLGVTRVPGTRDEAKEFIERKAASGQLGVPKKSLRDQLRDADVSMAPKRGRWDHHGATIDTAAGDTPDEPDALRKRADKFESDARTNRSLAGMVAGNRTDQPDRVQALREGADEYDKAAKIFRRRADAIEKGQVTAGKDRTPEAPGPTKVAKKAAPAAPAKKVAKAAPKTAAAKKTAEAAVLERNNKETLDKYRDMTRDQYDALSPEQKKEADDTLGKIRDSGDQVPHTIPSNRTSMGTTIRGLKASPDVEESRKILRRFKEVKPQPVDHSPAATVRKIDAIKARADLTPDQKYSGIRVALGGKSKTELRDIAAEGKLPWAEHVTIDKNRDRMARDAAGIGPAPRKTAVRKAPSGTPESRAAAKKRDEAQLADIRTRLQESKARNTRPASKSEPAKATKTTATPNVTDEKEQLRRDISELARTKNSGVRRRRLQDRLQGLELADHAEEAAPQDLTPERRKEWADSYRDSIRNGFGHETASREANIDIAKKQIAATTARKIAKAAEAPAVKKVAKATKAAPVKKAAKAATPSAVTTAKDRLESRQKQARIGKATGSVDLADSLLRTSDAFRRGDNSDGFMRAARQDIQGATPGDVKNPKDTEAAGREALKKAMGAERNWNTPEKLETKLRAVLKDMGINVDHRHGETVKFDPDTMKGFDGASFKAGDDVSIVRPALSYTDKDGTVHLLRPATVTRRRGGDADTGPLSPGPRGGPARTGEQPRISRSNGNARFDSAGNLSGSTSNGDGTYARLDQIIDPSDPNFPEDGIPVRDFRTHGYDVKKGHLTRHDGVLYLTEEGDGPNDKEWRERTLRDTQKWHGSLSEKEKTYVKSISSLSGANPADPYWQERRGLKDFESAATAGNGEINIYKHGGDYAYGSNEATLDHELGHLIDQSGSTRHRVGSESERWHQAGRSDNVGLRGRAPGFNGFNRLGEEDADTGGKDTYRFGVSRYGTSSPAEDFADSYGAYKRGWLGTIDDPDNPGLRRKVHFRELYPARAAIFDDLFPGRKEDQLREIADYMAKEPSVRELIDFPMDYQVGLRLREMDMTQLRALAKKVGDGKSKYGNTREGLFHHIMEGTRGPQRRLKSGMRETLERAGNREKASERIKTYPTSLLRELLHELEVQSPGRGRSRDEMSAAILDKMYPPAPKERASVRATERTRIPEAPQRGRRPNVSDVTPTVLTGRQGLDTSNMGPPGDTGPDGIPAKDFTLRSGYNIQHGTFFRQDRVPYLIEHEDTPEGAAQAKRIQQALWTHRQSLPLSKRRLQRSYGWVRGEHPGDREAAIRLGADPNDWFSDAVSDNQGGTTLYNRDRFGSEGVDQNLDHEFAHSLDHLGMEAGESGSDTSEWRAAQGSDAAHRQTLSDVTFDQGPGEHSPVRLKDVKPNPGIYKALQGVTDYGSTDDAEDFAESFRLYRAGPIGKGRRVKGGPIEPLWFRDIFPARAAILDNAVPDFAEKQLREINQARGTELSAAKRRELIKRLIRERDNSDRKTAFQNLAKAAPQRSSVRSALSPEDQAFIDRHIADNTPPTPRISGTAQTGSEVRGLFGTNIGPEGVEIGGDGIILGQHGYTIKNGRAWRDGDDLYVIEGTDPRRMRQQMEAFRAETRTVPRELGQYTRTYIVADGDSPAAVARLRAAGVSNEFLPFASAGDGNITFWGRAKGGLLGQDRQFQPTLRHEGSHNADVALGNISTTSEWSSATRKGTTGSKVRAFAQRKNVPGQSALRPPGKDRTKDMKFPDGVTPYATSSVREDWAESAEFYFGTVEHGGVIGTGKLGGSDQRVPIWFRDLYPARAAVLDKKFPEFARQQLDEVRRLRGDGGSRVPRTRSSIRTRRTPEQLTGLRVEDLGNLDLRDGEELTVHDFQVRYNPAAGSSETLPIKTAYVTKRNGQIYVVDQAAWGTEPQWREQSVAFIDKHHANIPPEIAQHQRGYMFIADQNPYDAYFEAQYGPGFGAQATAGMGDGFTYLWDRFGHVRLGGDDADQDWNWSTAVPHESGHNVDQALGWISMSPGWGYAARSDDGHRRRFRNFKPSPDSRGASKIRFETDLNRKPNEIDETPFLNGVTAYGTTDAGEDFADSIALYMQGQVGQARFGRVGRMEPAWFRDIFPARAAILDAKFPEFAQQQLAQIRAQRPRRPAPSAASRYGSSSRHRAQ